VWFFQLPDRQSGRGISMRYLSLFLTLALTVGGCAGFTTPDMSEVGPYPSNYRHIVAQAVRSEFFDPSSLQAVYIAAPFPVRWELQKGWGVCLRANGKNRMGAYAGQQEYGYLFVNGVIVLEGDYVNCNTAQYIEWPEMEGAGWEH
jgi:hypothetical protein